MSSWRPKPRGLRSETDDKTPQNAPRTGHAPSRSHTTGDALDEQIRPTRGVAQLPFGFRRPGKSKSSTQLSGSVHSPAGEQDANGDLYYSERSTARSPSPIHSHFPVNSLKALDPKPLVFNAPPPSHRPPPHRAATEDPRAHQHQKTASTSSVVVSSSSQGQGKRRWNTLRSHVVPGQESSPDSTPASSPPPIPQQFSPTLSSQALPPAASRSVPAPPKASRFQKLGFRHVAEQIIRDDVANEITLRFTQEIMRACVLARFPEVKKHERDAVANILASTSQFMSSVSLGTVSALDANAMGRTGQNKYGLRRPGSMQSLAKAAAAPHVPSLRPLHQIIMYNAPAAGKRDDQLSVLPNERDILATLLLPFMDPKYGLDNEAERQLAIEAFQVIMKTWSGSNEQLELERSLWCCKAATAASPSEFPRLVSVLNSMLALPERAFASKPVTLHSIVIALFTLLYKCRRSPENMTFLKGLIKQVIDGLAGELDGAAIEEEYAVTLAGADTASDARALIVLEGFTKSLEIGSLSVRWWLLINVLPDYWSIEAIRARTPLQAAIHTRKISSFLRSSVSLLSHHGIQEVMQGTEEIWRIMRGRVLPELVVLESPEAAMQLAARVMIALASHENIADRAIDSIRNIAMDAVWKPILEKELKFMITGQQWDEIVPVLLVLVSGMIGPEMKDAMSAVVSTLFDRLVDDPPADPHPALTQLLDLAARIHPQIFYKPIFVCVASSKELTVANHLATFASVSRFLPDFWMRDPEMIAIALLNDVGSKGKVAESLTWAKARLGRAAVLVELIDKVRALRTAKGDQQTTGDPSYSTVVKFLTALELRLSVALDAKEKTTLLPFSQRKLICALLLEIRLFTHSLKPATWLRRVVSWALAAQFGDNLPSTNLVVDETPVVECSDMSEKLRLVYEAAREGSRSTNKQRSTMMFSPHTKTTFVNDKMEKMQTIFENKLRTVSSLNLPLIPYILELAVAVNALLTVDDFARLGAYLWKSCLDGQLARTAASASFLVMQYGERSPDALRIMVIDDLVSSDVMVRRQAVARLGTLMSCRLQLLSQRYITDRSHRRPFKLTRSPITYVPTDVGSSQFVSRNEPVDPQGATGAIPAELRKQLIDVGWAQDEEPVLELEKWARTPMTLLPNAYNDRGGDMRSDQSPSPSPSPSPNASPQATPQKGETTSGSGLLRKPSSGGQGTRRRPVLVPAILAVLPRLAMLANDPDFTVAQAATDVAMDFMRDDPGVICRPIFDSLSDATIDIGAAATALRAFLHVRRDLPPALSHHIFNNLAGYLKFCARDPEDEEVLEDFAYSTPILANLATQVSEMSVRQLRRAKVEIFLMPSGSLWFPHTAPPGPMFPRDLGMDLSEYRQGPHMPARLSKMIMVRISQHRFFMSILKEHPQEVQLVRHHLVRFVLPTNKGTEYHPLDLFDFIPHHPDRIAQTADLHDRALEQLSLTLARSYLLLLVQVFRSMSRHFNDRDELAGMIEGVNRALVTHGDDIGVVSHSLLAFMTASTRFKRLITSGGGYSLFMPALIKVYAEAEKNPPIRSAIEYAVERFYALHEEVFVFQTLDIMSHLLVKPGVDEGWIARHLFTLLYSLNAPKGTSVPDAAGIYPLFRTQEREARLASAVDEKPAVLASLRNKGITAQDMSQFLSGVDREVKRLQPENIIKLILTVVAHDPGLQRSERMLHLFRWLTPHAFEMTPMRAVLNDGIDALGKIFVSRALGSATLTKAKLDNIHGQPDLAGLEVTVTDNILENMGTSSSGTSTASDNNAMRQDFLHTVIAYLRAGGVLLPGAMHRVLDLIKFMLRDDSLVLRNRISKLLGKIVEHTLLTQPPPPPKTVTLLLREIYPILKSYAFDVHLDFAHIFDVIAKLCANPDFAGDQAFSAVVVTHICGPALEHLEEAAAAQMLFASVSRRSVIKLVAQSVPLIAADVLGVVEQRQATPGFLAGVIFPLVLSLQTGEEVAGGTQSQSRDTWRREMQSKAWSRLLVYIMEACIKRPPDKRSSGSIRGSSSFTDENQREKTQTKTIPVTTVAIAITIIKVVVTRAEKDVTRSIPGIWMRLAAFLKTLLEDGNAMFALLPNDPFAPSSPSYSRESFDIPSRPSMDRDNSFLAMQAPVSPISSSKRQSVASPRLVDYLMWSMLEFLHLRRNPLLLQLRLFTQEKVATLDAQLRSHGEATPRRSRRVSSVFAKPRMRSSGVYSAASTPEGTPRLSANAHPPGSPTKLTLTPPSMMGREPGFNVPPSPSSPTRHKMLGGSKIVHLGPTLHTPPSLFHPPSSPGRGEFSSTVLSGNSQALGSPVLASYTYRRVRLVQMVNGYERFLPFDEEGEFVQVQSWSKRQAIDAIVDEMRDLLAEFSEDFYVGDMDIVF